MLATRTPLDPTVPGVAPKHTRAALRRELVRLSHLVRNSPRGAAQRVRAVRRMAGSDAQAAPMTVVLASYWWRFARYLERVASPFCVAEHEFHARQVKR